MSLKRSIASLYVLIGFVPFTIFGNPVVSDQISEDSTAGAEKVEIDGDLVVEGNSDSSPASASLEVHGDTVVTGDQQVEGDLYVDGAVVLAQAQGDISMGAFGPYTLTYQSDFSNDVDSWIGDGGTGLSVSGGVLSATVGNSGVYCHLKRNVGFANTNPHRITAVFSGSATIGIRSWNSTTTAFDYIYTNWDGVEPIIVNPTSQSIVITVASQTFQLDSITIEEINQ